MEPILRVRALGPLRVERDDVTLAPETWRRQRAADLLNILALAPDRAVSRDRLVAALWPTKDLKRGLNNLHRASHDLRAELGGSFVSNRGGVVRLDPAVWVDVEVFEAHADTVDEVREALALYRGRPRCDVDEPLELGLDPRIEGLHQRFVEHSLKAGRQAHTLGDTDGAIAVLRHLVEVDPQVAEGHRLLVRALDRAGRRDEALRHLGAIEEQVEERGWLDALRESLEDANEAPAGPAGPERIARMLLGTARPGPLRGREAEEAELAAFLDRGHGVLVVQGDIGQGKSRLALSAVERAMAAGTRVMVGAALDVAGMPPYAPFVEAFHDRARALGRPSPFVGASSGRAGNRMAVYRGVLDALEEDCTGGALMLVLEDLHHADESSLHLLRYLARATRTLPLSILATARRTDPELGNSLDTTLMNLERERLGRRLTLHALDPEATRKLVRDRSDRIEGEAVDQIARLSGGNPLYAEELVLAFEERGEVAVPDELGDAVRERVARLGDVASGLLGTAAVIGTRFDLELAAAVAHLELDAALDAVDAAISGQVLHEDGDALRFRHALVREALYEGLSGPRRRALHRRVAAALQAEPLGRRADRHRLLAWHHLEAGAPGEALPHLIEAGRQAHKQSGLFEAARFFQQALQILVERDGPADQRLDVMMRLGRARRGLSEIGRAVEQFDAAASLAAELGRPLRRAQALRLSALALITAGQLPPAEERLGWALAALEGHDDPIQRADMLYHLAQLRWHQNRYQEAYDLAVRCGAEAARTDHVRTRARAQEILALACHSLGRAAEGQAAEQARQALVGSGLDASGAFEVHL